MQEAATGWDLRSLLSPTGFLSGILICLFLVLVPVATQAGAWPWTTRTNRPAVYNFPVS
jgi:hypothetical protein